MVFKNKFFNTRPCVLHNPTPHYLWDIIIKEFFNTKRKKIKLHDLTIVTWNNKKSKSILERSLEHLGLKCVVLGKGIKSWNNTLKIKLINKALPKIKTNFVMGVDAFDAIILSDPNKSIDILNFYNADMVFNATCGTVYSSKRLIEFCDNQFSRYPMRNPNAGAWIAKTKFCRRFFNKMAGITINKLVKFMHEEEFPNNPTPSLQWCSKSEQLRMKFIFEKLYPRVTIDYQCQFFQILNNFNCHWGNNQGVAPIKMHL